MRLLDRIKSVHSNNIVTVDIRSKKEGRKSLTRNASRLSSAVAAVTVESLNEGKRRREIQRIFQENMKLV